MKIIKQKIPYLLFIGLMAGLFCACNFAPFEGEAQVTLDLGWLTPSDAGQESETRASTVQGAPANIVGQVTSIEITISGPGVNTITRTYYEWPRYLSVSVPPGKERTIGLRINVDPASDSAVLAFGGEATIRYISAGEQEKVQIQIAPVETKLVIPDSNNNRIVQINNITGANLIEKNGLSAVDIDFDAQGRIYIADPLQGLLRTPEITPNSVTDAIDRNTAVFTLTMHRNQNYLYYTSTSGPIIVFDCDFDDMNLGLVVSYDLTIEAIGGNFECTGIDVDDEGCVYIVDRISPAIHKYDPRLPLTTRIVATYTDDLNSPYDIIVKGNYVYVLNYNGANGLKIIKLTKNLYFVAGYGENTANYPDHNPGQFYGPLRFLARDNSVFTIIDDWNTRAIPGADSDKLIQVNPSFTDSSWKTFGSYGNGIGQFDFWIDS